MGRVIQNKAEAARVKYHAVKAMVDGATTDGERAAAQHALDAHVRRHGVPEEKVGKDFQALFDAVGGGRARSTDDVRRVGRGEWARYCRWKHVTPELSPELQRAMAPDHKVVLMSCIRTRKEHRCMGCGTEFPRGARLWRPILYNGNYRMDRLCPTCFAPDPKAPPTLEQVD